ncbi:MAG: SH3 domain-containing protein [Saprospiraceae bacterium]|nr:SH3 domain-containing protein [Saprospiraceae bacterium]
MRIKWIAWAVLLLAAACVSRNKDAERNREEGQPARLDVIASAAFLREAAGENAKVIQRLPKGASLFALPEVSRFTTPLQLQGKTFDEPWLLVKTPDGAKGWVYAADVQLHASRNRPGAFLNSKTVCRVWPAPPSGPGWPSTARNTTLSPMPMILPSYFATDARSAIRW